MVEHPASMTHSMIVPEEQVKEGIDPGGLRISVGPENVQDVLQASRERSRKSEYIHQRDLLYHRCRERSSIRKER